MTTQLLVRSPSPSDEEKRREGREQKTRLPIKLTLLLRSSFRLQIHTSRLSSPRSVRALSSAQNIHRLRLVDNSSDSEPPKVVYDSKDDPEWGANGKEIDVEAYAFAAERGAEAPVEREREKL